ncbi:MAG TPA: tetratricopeptide repeat protein [Chloroflexia bacterium]|nr:tetratricopeptide repeat protein [Chloroflexia bacterium]
MEVNPEQAHFREQIKALRRAAGFSQKDLAEAIGLNHQVLSRKLSGRGPTGLTRPEVRQIVKTLAGWQALTRVSEVLELLALMGMGKEAFSLEEWQQPPLNLLEASNSSTVSSPEPLPSITSAPASAPLPAPQVFPDELASFNNLPAPLTDLVGREWAIEQAGSILKRRGVRVLTLLGPGGIGKTRLALALSQELHSDFQHGVCFVGLGSVTDPRLIVPTIASALDLRELTNNPLKQLQAYLRDKQLLLVLDNFEQIVEGATQISELLTRAPGLKVLVTSREPLRIYGERQFGVPALDLPDLDHLPQGQRLHQYESVRLFVERAQAVRPDFTLTVQNERAVARICQLLEGLPLAIELAAAWVKVLPPRALLERLSQPHKLAVLVGGAANWPARHQTLRNTLEWSYQLLPPSQQELFTSLAVFRNGFTLGAVHQVCPEESYPESPFSLIDQTLEKLVALLEKNLLKQEWAEPDAQATSSLPRFTMLETVREYGLERLKQSAQVADLHRRHAVYYTQLTEKAATNLVGTTPQVDASHLEQELDNLRAALDWCRESGEMALNFRLLSNVWRFWRFWGLISEGRGYLESALARIVPAELTINSTSKDFWWLSSYAEALYGAGILAVRQSDYPKASDHLQQGLALAKQSEDEMATAKFLCALGELNRRQALFEAASSYYEQSLELYQKIGDKSGIGVVYHNLGALANLQNNHSLARHYCEEALSIWEKQNNKLGLTGTYNVLADVALAEGSYRDARLFSERSLALKQELGDKTGKSRLYLILGYECLAERAYREAGELFWNSLELLRMVDDKADLARCLSGLGFLLLAQNDYTQARTFFVESLRLKQKECRPGNLIGLATLLKEQGEAVQSIQLCGTIQKLVETEKSPLIDFFRSEYEHTLSSLRATYDPEDFESAWQEGYSFKGAVQSIQEGSGWIAMLGQTV